MLSQRGGTGTRISTYRDTREAEVRQKGSAASELRTADQTDACRFWGSISGNYVWNLAAIDLGTDRGFEMSENARLLARLNLAIADAVIACWDAKYFYQFRRSITAIRLEDPTWTPLVVTPAFPEYTSGHSSIAGAAATVLGDSFGEDTPFILESSTGPGWTRFFPNFSTALDEVADARVLGGIHFRAACVVGTTAGSDVATYILENQMNRIHGNGE